MPDYSITNVDTDSNGSITLGNTSSFSITTDTSTSFSFNSADAQITVSQEQIEQSLRNAVISQSMRSFRTNETITGALFDAIHSSSFTMSARSGVQTLVNDGPEATAEVLFEDAMVRIDEAGGSFTSRFREVCSDWPEPIAVYFGEFLLDEGAVEDSVDEERLESYVDANASRFPDISDGDVPLEENPFNDGALRPPEALSVTVARLNGIPMTAGEIMDIPDHEKFRELCREAETYDEVLDSIQYSPEISEVHYPDLLPPEEWPSGADPMNPRPVRCEYCGGNYYEVFTDEGTKWVHGPEMVDIIYPRESSEIAVLSQEVPDGICAACEHRIRDRRNKYLIITGDTCAEVGVTGDLVISMNGEPLDDIPRDVFSSIAMPGGGSEFLDESSDVISEHTYSSLKNDGPEPVQSELGDGSWLAIRKTESIGDSSYDIMMDVTDFDSVHASKQLRDGVIA